MHRGIGGAGGDCQPEKAQLLKAGPAGLWELESQKGPHRFPRKVWLTVLQLCANKVLH